MRTHVSEFPILKITMLLDFPSLQVGGRLVSKSAERTTAEAKF